MSAGLEHTLIATNGIRLHAVTAGPERGPVVIFLHGFPEFWYGWRRQIGYFAELGYRVIVPDLRGYNLSDKPAELADYSLDKLAADVTGIIDSVRWHQVALVGHDWGGGIAFWLAMKQPGRISRLVVLNAPHIEAFQRQLKRSPGQMWRSRYMLYLQLPWLPEKLLSMGDYSRLVRALRKTSRPGTFSDDDLVHYRKAWSQPEALHSMLNWYRAGFQFPPKLPGDSSIQVATLLIWGDQDQALRKELAQASIARCPYGELVMIEGATHWVQHEEPERVNTLIANFLRGS
jgi:pimeloyl-ACP methyl ester carboxylesterase